MPRASSGTHGLILPEPPSRRLDSFRALLIGLTLLNTSGVIGLTFYLGEKNQQLNDTTSRTNDLQANGSSWTKARLDAQEQRIRELSQEQMHQADKLFDVINGTSEERQGRR